MSNLQGNMIQKKKKKEDEEEKIQSIYLGLDLSLGNKQDLLPKSWIINSSLVTLHLH